MYAMSAYRCKKGFVSLGARNAGALRSFTIMWGW